MTAGSFFSLVALIMGAHTACLGQSQPLAHNAQPLNTLPRYSAQDIPVGGSCSAQPVLMADGTVFGAWLVKKTDGFHCQLTLCKNGTRIVEATLPVGEEILSCNPNGTAVGYKEVGELGKESHSKHVLFWDGTAMRDLGTMNHHGASASDVNADGAIVGVCYDSVPMDDKTGGSLRQTTGFLWKNGSVQFLDQFGSKYEPLNINIRGQVIGSWSTPLSPVDHEIHSFSFVYQNYHVQDLGMLGGNSVHTFSINDLGQIVGNASTESGCDHAFLWKAGRMHDLGTLGGKSSYAHAVNNAGQVVGSSQSASGESRAVLWQAGRIIDLNQCVPKTSLLRLNAAIYINDRGQILAVGSPNWEKRDEYSIQDSDLHMYLLKTVNYKVHL